MMSKNKYFHVLFDKASKHSLGTFDNFDRTKDVQAQLQEMVRGLYRNPEGTSANYSTSKADNLLRRFHAWHDAEMQENRGKLPNPLIDIEVLWLKFVMKVKFKKIWKGDDWIGI